MKKPVLAVLTTVATTASLGAGAGLATASPAGQSGKPTSPSIAPTLSVAALERTIRARVAAGYSPAIVAGVLGADGRTRIVTAGRAGRGQRLGADTLFEIGSITKPFTGILLADAARRGEVRLDQPVAELLPAGTKVPASGERQITLKDLATQSSGLPALPPNLLASAADPANPYAGFTRADLLASLAETPLSQPVGTAYGYSNLGFGLLGDALSIRTGLPYEQLVRDRITGPLGLRSTGITLTPEQRTRLVAGHDGDGRKTPAWDFDALAGAGALRSSAADVLRFAKANLAAPAGPGTLGPALADAQAEHFTSGDVHQGLAWVRQAAGDRTIIWHNGGTGGFDTFLGLDPAGRQAVVVLSASSSRAGVTDIGLNALDPASPLATLPKQIALSPKALRAYTGTYVVEGGERFTIERRGGALAVVSPGQPEQLVYPASRTAFFARSVAADLVFALDRKGRVTGVDLTAAGETARATKA